MSDAHIVRLEIPATHLHLRLLGPCISTLIDGPDSAATPSPTAYNVHLAVHEACANIVDHAYAEIAGGRIGLTFTCHDSRSFVVDLHDTGRSFNLDDAAEPDLAVPQTEGYGLFLVRALMDEVVYEPQDGDNHWRLVKQIPHIP